MSGGWGTTPPPPSAFGGYPIPPPPPPPPGSWFAYSLASPGARPGARILDGLILGVPIVIAVVILLSRRAVRNPDGSLAGYPSGKVALLTLAVAFAGSLYEILFIHFKGATPGKMAMKVKVCRIEDGGLPSWNRASLRYVVPLATGSAGRLAVPSAPGLGGLAEQFVFLWLLWDKKRQGLHDKVARTVVIRTDR